MDAKLIIEKYTAASNNLFAAKDAEIVLIARVSEWQNAEIMYLRAAAQQFHQDLMSEKLFLQRCLEFKNFKFAGVKGFKLFEQLFAIKSDRFVLIAYYVLFAKLPDYQCYQSLLNTWQQNAYCPYQFFSQLLLQVPVERNKRLRKLQFYFYLACLLRQFRLIKVSNQSKQK